MAPATQPVWAKTSKTDRVFFLRVNNSTRAVPVEETTAYISAHFFDQPRGAKSVIKAAHVTDDAIYDDFGLGDLSDEELDRLGILHDQDDLDD